MPNKVTVSGKVGPDRGIANHVIDNATKFSLDLQKKLLTVEMDTGALGGSNSRDIDLNGVTSVLFTVVSGNYTIKVG